MSSGHPSTSRPVTVETVLGPTDVSNLGTTHIHEHLFLDLRRSPGRIGSEPVEPLALYNYYEARRCVENPHTRVLDSVSEAVDELCEFARCGGRTIVDVTPICLRRRPSELVFVARATGVNIVMSGGYYTHQYHCEEAHTLPVEELTAKMVADCNEGVPIDAPDEFPSVARGGVIGEIGLTWPVAPCESRVLDAAARAQAATGKTLIIHPGRDPEAPMAALRAAETAGANPARIVMSHIDRTLDDLRAIGELAATGAFVAFDLFGHESSYYSHFSFLLPNDAGRLKMIRALFEKGFETKVLISQDFCNKTHLTRYGGEGYAHILRRVVPIMEQLGMSAELQRRLLISNPAFALTGVDVL